MIIKYEINNNDNKVKRFIPNKLFSGSKNFDKLTVILPDTWVECLANTDYQLYVSIWKVLDESRFYKLLMTVNNDTATIDIPETLTLKPCKYYAGFFISDTDGNKIMTSERTYIDVYSGAIVEVEEDDSEQYSELLALYINPIETFFKQFIKE